MAGFYIEDWMIEREGLSGFELLAFALIHTCTQKGDGCWHAGYDKLALRIGATQRTAIMCVKSLEEAGLIRMYDATIGGKIRKALESIVSSENISYEKISSEKISEQRGEKISPNNIDIDNNKKEEYTLVYSKKESAKRFVKPSLEEIRDYCRERHNTIDAEKFFYHYEANGWMVGPKKPMKNWKAAVITWEKNQKEMSPQPTTKPEKILSWKDIEK